MTVQAQDSVQYYDGPIVAGTVISITDFTFIDNSHISMKIRNVDGIWEYGVDYTVDGAGTLERTATILREVEAGQTLAVYLDVPITQNISPEEGGNFPASTNEFVLDKLTYICQMLYERVARSMQVSIDNPFDGTLSVLVPGKAIKINAAGNGLELSDLDPDKAVEEIQRYIEIAEAAAEAAEQSKDTAQEIVDGLNVTKEQVDEAAEAAIHASEVAIERIDQAEKHKLNSKEVGSLLLAPGPQSSTDLHLADGSIVTSEDEYWAELHNIWAKRKRALTDVVTNYYRYYSYNYSRIWYCTKPSTPDKYYELDNIINSKAGTWGLFDRHGDFIVKSTINVKSYYKYELINAVGHVAPDYLLWQVFEGDAQLAEPGNDHLEEFYAYADDERLGAHLDNVTNIVVLPPDITSPYRRIQFTIVDGANTYYYYYKATPVEIHAYMFGSVADLNLSSVAGTQTDATVVHPYLIPTHRGHIAKRTNPNFASTEDRYKAIANGEDYADFYTTDSSLDKTFDIDYLHDEVEVVGGYLTNRAGVFSGFSNSNYLRILKEWPKTTNFDGTVTVDPIKSFEFYFPIHSASVRENTSNGSVIFGPEVGLESCLLFRVGNTDTSYGGANHICFALVPVGTTSYTLWLASLNAIDLDKDYIIKVKYGLKQFDITPEGQEEPVYEYKQMLELYLGETEDTLELQAEREVAIGSFKWPINKLRIGQANEWSNNCYCQGAIDLPNSYIKINGNLWWGNKVVPYAKDSNNEYIQDYAYNKLPEYEGELAANVWETNPEGYTVIGNAPDVDGWFSHTTSGQGLALGTGVNNQFIQHRNDNYIDIKCRFYSGRPSTSASNWGYFELFKDAINSYGPLLLYHNANNNIPTLAAGRSGNSWNINHVSTGITIDFNCEYLFHLYADFTKKYKLEDGEYIEADDGTLYKYVLEFKKWIGPEDDAEIETSTFYHTYRFGAGSNDNYNISGIGTNGYVVDMGSVNMYSVEVNNRHIFKDNIHVVDRPANSTMLPTIIPFDSEGQCETYVVVANGVTEEVILATPKEAIDNYVDDVVLPEIAAKKNEATQLYNNYNDQMEQTYREGVRALQNASDAVTHAELVTVCPIIQSYYDEDTGSFYHIFARNSHGYYCIQGSMFGTHSTTYTDTYVNFFKKFKDIKYQAFAIQSNHDDVQYAGVWDKQQHRCMFGQVYNNQGYASWFAMGYLEDSEVVE